MSSNSVCNHTRDKQNRSPAARSSDFVITRVITDRIGLHSVLLPLLTTLNNLLQSRSCYVILLNNTLKIIFSQQT